MSGGLPPGAVSPFAGVRVVVVGSAMVDQITYCRRVPEEGETLRADRHVQGFGGKGANQALMAARLGATVTFVGCIGDDASGAATIDNLASHGVDTSAVSVVAGSATGVAPIWVDESGANRILIAGGANDALEAGRVAAALDGLGWEPDVIIAQLETPQDAVAAGLAWGLAHGAHTVLNPAPAAPIDAELSSAAEWLVANESEFAALFGVVPDITAVADAVSRGGHRIVVTLGADGAIFADGEASGHITAPAVVPVDTTGAGDAFVGAFGVALGAGLRAADAVHLGCAAGALSVTAPGTQTSLPSLRDVLQVLPQTTTMKSINSDWSPR